MAYEDNVWLDEQAIRTRNLDGSFGTKVDLAVASREASLQWPSETKHLQMY